MHEIVTLQFGQQANYLGVHYWNAQESYFTYDDQTESPVNHDISFRAGVGADGHDTYTPRTVIYDLKGAFGTLRRENALYELQQQDLSTGWSGSTVPLHLPRIQASAYQHALDQGQSPPTLSRESVRFWSDYNHVYYHPRSIVQLNEYELNSSLMPFERHATGVELFAQLDREHDLLDRDLRPFLEECDQLQGLQVMTSIDDAWGGFTAAYLERVADELGKGCRWVFGTQHGSRTTRERQSLQDLNSAQAMVALHPSSSLHIPLAVSHATTLPPYLQLDAACLWHTSSLQALLLDSTTLPTRLRQAQPGRATLDMLEMELNRQGHRRIATAGLSMNHDLPISSAAAAVNGTAAQTNGLPNGHHSNDARSSYDIDLFPSGPSSSADETRRVAPKTHVFDRIEVVRGSWGEGSLDTNGVANHDGRQQRRQERHETRYETALVAPWLSSSPDIIAWPGQSSVERVAVRAALSTSTAVGRRLRACKTVAQRMVSVEERETLGDGLLTMAEEYEDGWSDDDDDGTDDE